VTIVPFHRLCAIAAVFLAFDLSAESTDGHEALAFDIYKELIETNTTYSQGDTAVAAQKLANRLLGAGFPPEDVRVIANAPKKGNLVARLRSPAPAKGPILLLAHLDVVEADPRDWSFDPFTLLDRDDHYYGRGTTDDKDEAAIHVANLIRMKQEGYVPNRDIIVALTADEEGGPDNGVEYLLAHHRDLVTADFVLNEGGGGVILDGAYVANTVQSAEKVYQSYTLEITDAGGHSSRPKPYNPIYELAAALTRIARYEFPVMLNETTRAFFRRSGKILPPEQAGAVAGLLETPPREDSVAVLSKDPTMNALPQRARATINCRILPGIPPDSVKARLTSLVANESISITPVKEATPSEPSPLTAEVMDPIRAITEDMWPGVPVVPAMSTGATDGLYFRNAGIPVYGVSGIFVDATDSRAHGRDERILKKSFYDGLEFLDRLVRALSSPADMPGRATPL